MINVTKSFLPPIEEYTAYLEKIWQNQWLTNNGPLLLELEAKLKEYFGVKHLFFVSNGTIALQLAIKAMNLKGEIITTPYSYVATTTAILWENCKPVFVDVEEKNCNINADLIEEKINENTEAILATHVYGIPCNVLKIKELAEKYNLKVIYDAAHAFGINYQNQSLVSYGDISTLSFHATKLFHTIEGGAIITDDDKLAEKISLLRAFGHVGEDNYYSMGINGKNSEFHAAMGLCNLPKIPQLVAARKSICDLYDSLLDGGKIYRPFVDADTAYKYAYYPVIFKDEAQLMRVRNALFQQDIKPRRYFYPSLNTLHYLQTKYACPVSESYANRVLCLPLYVGLEENDVKRIAEIVLNNL